MGAHKPSDDLYRRAIVAGAVVGGVVSAVQNWQRQQQGGQDIVQSTANVAKDAAKAAVVTGATIFVGDTIAKRPGLTLGTAIAGLYLLDIVRQQQK